MARITFASFKDNTIVETESDVKSEIDKYNKMPGKSVTGLCEAFQDTRISLPKKLTAWTDPTDATAGTTKNVARLGCATGSWCGAIGADMAAAAADSQHGREGLSGESDDCNALHDDEEGECDLGGV